MADLVIDPAEVHITSNTVTEKVQGGELMSPGQACYRKVSDNKYYLADIDVPDESVRVAICVQYCPTADDYFDIATDGIIDLGVNLQRGRVYGVSTTPGGIRPICDTVGTGAYPVILGMALSWREFDIQIHDPGIQRLGTGWLGTML